MRITYKWKDSYRNEWEVYGGPPPSLDEDKTCIWWFVARNDEVRSFRFPVEKETGLTPTKRDVALAMASYITSVAFSLAE